MRLWGKKKLLCYFVAVGYEYFSPAFSQDPWPQVRQDTERVQRPHLLRKRSRLHTRWTQLTEVSHRPNNAFHQEKYSLHYSRQFRADLSFYFPPHSTTTTTTALSCRCFAFLHFHSYLPSLLSSSLHSICFSLLPFFPVVTSGTHFWVMYQLSFDYCPVVLTLFSRFVITSEVMFILSRFFKLSCPY